MRAWSAEHPSVNAELLFTTVAVGAAVGAVHPRTIDGVAATVRERRAAAAEIGLQAMQARLSAVRTLRFLMGWQPEVSKPGVLRCTAAMLRQGELADLAVEDLRRWKAWDLTAEVLACYGRQGVDSPLIRQAVIRYALVCPPDDRTRAFLADRRRLDADLVRQAEESLLYEKR